LPELQPKALVMRIVPGILTIGVVKEITAELTSLNYESAVKVSRSTQSATVASLETVWHRLF
jgi:hypothetical protein